MDEKCVTSTIIAIIIVIILTQPEVQCANTHNCCNVMNSNGYNKIYVMYLSKLSSTTFSQQDVHQVSGLKCSHKADPDE